MNKQTPMSQRLRQIKPFYVMEILAQAKQLEAQGHDVIHLEVGEADFQTPDSIKDAARVAIDEGKTFYTAATGLPQLREKIAAYYQQRFSVAVNAKNIVITPGASGALQLALSVIINSGNKVLMADPGYPCNRHFVRLLDGEAKTIAVGADTQYQLTHQLIEQHWDKDTICALLASPSNPTGTLISATEMQAIADVVREHQGVLIVDEIYQGLVYDQPDFTAASLSAAARTEEVQGEVTGGVSGGVSGQSSSTAATIFVINSFSKFFSMTGWRLGWLIVPDQYLDAVERLAQNLFLAPPTLSQYAALAAFEDSTLKLLDGQRQQFKLRRNYLLRGLQQLGFQVNVQPAGAFYIYANVSAFTQDSFVFCEQLLAEAHVAITPGIDFGEYQANLHVRFAYTQSIEKLQLALDRIGHFLTSYKDKTTRL